MKKIFVSMLLLTISAVSLQAQEGQQKPFRKYKTHPGMMKEQLKFSEEQKQKMKTLNEDFRKQMMDLRKNENITVKEWKSRMESLQKKHREDLNALLSQDQKAQIEKMKQERKAISDINAKARMDKMKLRLGLTSEQADKLTKQQAELMQKMKTIRESKSLDAAKKHEEIKALMKTRKENMKSILTEEQMKKIEELKRRHPGKKRRLS